MHASLATSRFVQLSRVCVAVRRCLPPMHPCPTRPSAPPTCDGHWDAERLERFMVEGRDWKAVEALYQLMVSGHASLGILGLGSLGQDTSSGGDAVVVLPVPRPDYTLPSAVVRPASVSLTPGEEVDLENLQRGTGSALVPSPPQDQEEGSGGLLVQPPLLDAGQLQEQQLGRRPVKDKRPRITYQVTLAYFGPVFFGWMAQPGGIPTVEGAVVAGIRAIVPGATGRSAVASAGRTDKGVSAVAQVLSFHTREDLSAEAMAAGLEGQAPVGTLRVVSVSRKPRSFHATFGAKWRRYVYLFPLRDQQVGRSDRPSDDEADVDISFVDENLKMLVGKRLDYTAFARDTPPGKSCECTLYTARASIVSIPASTAADSVGRGSVCADTPDPSPRLGGQGGLNAGAVSSACGADMTMPTRVMCIELVADRFLRRMVRLLVSTAVQLRRDTDVCSAVSSGSSLVVGGPHSLQEGRESLLRLVHTKDRTATARMPAPALGLCFAGVGYGDDESPAMQHD